MYEVCGEKELKVILALDPGDMLGRMYDSVDTDANYRPS
jgi:hypothetical protein